MDPVNRGGRVRLGRAGFVLALCLAAGLAAGSAAQRTGPALEYQVKAAFLLNFTKFVEWPSNAFSDPNAPLVLCVLGRDPFGHTLDEIVTGEVVSGHRLVVHRIGESIEPQSCHVVFLAEGTKDVKRTLKSLGEGVLTVGEGDTFLREGGAIAFVVVDRRVRFDINRLAAEQAGIKLSSKLLSVARAVEN
jgi:hypothetical protein